MDHAPHQSGSLASHGSIFEIVARGERLRSLESGRIIAGWFRAVTGWVARHGAELKRNERAPVPGGQMPGW